MGSSGRKQPLRRPLEGATVLGISALYHDSAAAVVRDGRVVAAAQQERFSRIKHDAAFPVDAIRSCLESAEVAVDGLDAVAYYDKPLTTFTRVLSSYVAAGPRGITTFPKAIREWGTRKLWTSFEIERGIRSLGYRMPDDLLYAEHHVSHAAAAFFPSPFERAAILTMDGVGEWTTSSIGVGRGRTVEVLREQHFPDSLGLLYSAFTSYCGFRVNSGEYKLMGLAPYGEPRYVDRILDHVAHLEDDGALRLDLRYFDFLTGRRMVSSRFEELFGGPAREPEGDLDQRVCDLARSVQEVAERVVLAAATTAKELTGERDLVLAGGVALNCVANGRLRDTGLFDRIWVQPAANDAGSALGCALWATHEVFEQSRTPQDNAMSGSLLGPRFAPDVVADGLEAAGRPFERIPDPAERARRVAGLLADGDVVAVFQGRMEFGPRALGNRSILADPRDPSMQRTLNLRIKQRESFRPFAPAVLADHAADWFGLAEASPYMTFVAPVAAEHARTEEHSAAEEQTDEWLAPLERLATVQSDIPAVTHVDLSARVQTVDETTAPDLFPILQAFHGATGCPVLVNTSFNLRGEPIVCTPEDAYRTFMNCDLDHLLIEDCLLHKADQPVWEGPSPRRVVD
ncbi:MAG: carbamoyltransferase [Acidimicrobiales bacterium]